MQDDEINKMFYFGYDPACYRAGLADSIKKAARTDSLSGSDASLIKRGKQALTDAINKELSSIDKPIKHVIPLSSGLDSRTILAALIHNPRVSKDDITTVSFGIPGTWDYEVGQAISEHFDVENIAINLDPKSFDWSESALREYTRSLDCPTKLFGGYVNAQVDKIFEDGYVVWSGHLGDPSVGSHQPNDCSDTWREACEYFIHYNKYTPEFANTSFNPMNILPDKPYLSKDKLSYEEQLDLGHRQTCYISPITIRDPSRYVAPFSRKEWLEFALNIPREKRRNRELFIKMLTSVFPEISKFPTDMKSGLPPTASQLRTRMQQAKLYLVSTWYDALGKSYTSPGTNYVDFESAFREETELRQTVHSLFRSFNQRVNGKLEYIWKDHQAGTDYSKEIRSICSVELYLSEIIRADYT